jgi:hypothetical protein
MIEEFNNKYNEVKNIIETLPTNNIGNRKRKTSYILEQKEEDNKNQDLVIKEIESRLKQFSNLKENEEIEKLKNELAKCNVLNEWNPYNTSYEKMHLDYYLYQLSRYYKDDLDGVNECINKIIESFKKVGITLTIEDFDYNELAREYMGYVLNNASADELKKLFEKLYWKNANIIKLIELNFKSIYLKKEKLINKYYELRHKEFLNKHKDEELASLMINLSSKLNETIGKDKCINFNNFINGTYTVAEFNDVSKIKERIFQDNYNKANLDELLQVLNEYKIIISNKYLFTNMKEKLDKKDTLSKAKSSVLKSIFNEEWHLKKINNRRNKKPLFGKKKYDEKWLFDYKNSIDSLIKYYDDLDNARFDDLVYTTLNKDSSILEVLKLICSNYLYYVSETLKLDEDQSINDITDKYNKLKDFVNYNNFYILNNIALLDERQMKELIVNKYQLENITLAIDNLLEDNIDNTIKDVKTLLNYEYLLESKINLEDINLYLEYEKIKSNN